MACSGSRCCQLLGFVGLELWDNKKGPEEAPRTPPEFGMALAIPGGAPGYDDDEEFGNNITHVSAQLPKGCASYTGSPQNVKARPYPPRHLQD
jgi:hypothetical protein